MAAAIRTAGSPLRQPKREPDSNSSQFLDEEPVVSLTDSDDDPLPLDGSKAWLRNPSASDTFEFGGVTGCFSTMEIYRNGRPVTLTPKEFKTLAYLIENARRVISRDELLNIVWGYENYPRTRTVDNHILRLRKNLECDPSRPVHFCTVRGAGYKFSPKFRYSFHPRRSEK
jgi:DNA-binding response OmpR family regulator